MTTYHEFMFPVEPKYLPALNVIRQPCARINYKLVNDEIEIIEISFHPLVLKHLSFRTDFISELQEATKEHYKDLCKKPEPEYNDLEQQEKKYL